MTIIDSTPRALASLPNLARGLHALADAIGAGILDERTHRDQAPMLVVGLRSREAVLALADLPDATLDDGIDDDGCRHPSVEIGFGAIRDDTSQPIYRYDLVLRAYWIADEPDAAVTQ